MGTETVFIFGIDERAAIGRQVEAAEVRLVILRVVEIQRDADVHRAGGGVVGEIAGVFPCSLTFAPLAVLIKTDPVTPDVIDGRQRQLEIIGAIAERPARARTARDACIGDCGSRITGLPLDVPTALRLRFSRSIGRGFLGRKGLHELGHAGLLARKQRGIRRRDDAHGTHPIASQRNGDEHRDQRTALRVAEHHLSGCGLAIVGGLRREPRTGRTWHFVRSPAVEP